MVDSNTLLKPSKIHGIGVFAKRNISAGEQIIQGGLALNQFQDEWILYLKENKIPSWELVYGFCMVNHSEFPNTHRNSDLQIISSKRILEGEEITENYNLLPDEHNPFKGFNLPKEIHESKYKYAK